MKIDPIALARELVRDAFFALVMRVRTADFPHFLVEDGIAELFRGERHDLHQSLSAHPGGGLVIEIAFHADQSTQQRGLETLSRGGFFDIAFDIIEADALDEG